MSFGYELAADVRADLRAMEPWLQEAFLDHVESVIEQPPALAADGSDTRHWFYIKRDAAEVVVRYRLLWNVTDSMASVVGLEHEALAEPDE